MADPIPFPVPNFSSLTSLSDAPEPGAGGVVVVGVEMPESAAGKDASKSDSAKSNDAEPARCLPSTLQLPDETVATIRQLIGSGEITGKSGEMTLIAGSGERWPLVLVLGWGKPSSRDRGTVFQLGSTLIRRLIDKRRKRVTVALGADTPEGTADALVAGMLSGCEGQHLYQSDPASHVPEAIDCVGLSDADIRRGVTLGQSINWTRRLVNEPPSIMNPTEFAERASAMSGEVGLKCEVWDEKRLDAEGCRAILAVGRGSDSPPRLVILRHDGGGDEPPLAIVGKGVTFDSGGLSIKPSDGMVDMKCDMAGAATVFGVMHALAKAGVRRNVIGLCGLAENMVSGDSYKLGDVIETRSGKTIEILNTDAEGRVVLADTLDVASQYQPEAIVDLATLTGACMVALGNEVAGLMTNNDALCDQVREAARVEGEPVWELPMFELYNEKVQSKVADIKNVGEGRWGGAITAAKFLENFVGDIPWVHIDIAGPAFVDSAKPHRDAGATGVMVRSLVRWIETRT